MSTTTITTKINEGATDAPVTTIEIPRISSPELAPESGKKPEPKGNFEGLIDDISFRMPIVARQCRSENKECIEKAIMFPSLYKVDGLHSASIRYEGKNFVDGFLIEGNRAPQPVFGSLKRQGYTVASLQGYFCLLPLGTYLMIKDEDVGMLADILNNPQFDPKRLSIDY